MYEFIEYVLYELKNSLVLALLAGLAGLGALFVSRYLYRKKHGAGSKFPWGSALLYLALAGYLVIVLYATLLRWSFYRMEYNLHLFRAWREAWNNYSAKNWANVLLNVAMFVPFGFLQPLLWKKCRNWYTAIIAGFGLSLAIELVQLMTGRGVCDVDDLFANTLGTLIGFFLGMTILTAFCQKRWKAGLVYCGLSLIPIAAICSIFLLYNIREYGNLPNAPAYVIDTSDTRWNLECELPVISNEAAVYKTQTRTRQDCDAFAEEFKAIIHTEYNTVSYYQEAAYYMDNGSDGGAHFLYVNYLDQGYTYCARFDDALWADADRETLEAALLMFPVRIPETAEFTTEGDGWHSFAVKEYVDGDSLFDGTLRVRYAADGSVRDIENQLLCYTFYAREAVISPEEAFDRLCAGKFNDGGLFAHQNPTDISVLSCTLGYAVDTKGFYQPVYWFEVVSRDGKYPYRIMIPAME